MAIYAVHDKTGRITKHGTASAQDIKFVDVDSGETLVLVDRMPNPADDSIVDGLLVNIALQPLAKSGYELMDLALTSLSKSDWTQLPDVTMSDERRAEWRVYRQALRDIINYRDPIKPESFDDAWPSQPA
jgi:hypothetical protein